VTTLFIDYATEIIPAAVVNIILAGDLNGDGSVTSADAALLRRYIAGVSVSIDLNAADIDRDGSVTSTDAALLSRYVVGWHGYDDYFIEVPVNP